MRKRQLELTLSKLRCSPSPILKLEAYDLDPTSAAELLFIAEERYHDIAGKTVVDLGCGSGILAIGAALLGSRKVVGIDINKESIIAARKNAESLELDIDFIAGDIVALRGRFDTTIMNPPFGTRMRGADVAFLKRAKELSRVIYSLHKRTKRSRAFLLEKIRRMGAQIDAIFELEITIPKTYSFHLARTYRIPVDLYRVIS
ncbi:MAG: METTL5 family protein [Candidatus Bathyarchaeia archaeon]